MPLTKPFVFIIYFYFSAHNFEIFPVFLDYLSQVADCISEIGHRRNETFLEFLFSGFGVSILSSAVSVSHASACGVVREFNRYRVGSSELVIGLWMAMASREGCSSRRMSLPTNGSHMGGHGLVDFVVYLAISGSKAKGAVGDICGRVASRQKKCFTGALVWATAKKKKKAKQASLRETRKNYERKK